MARTRTNKVFNKKQHAIEFINNVRAMDPAKLNKVVLDEAGEELARFFFAYSARLIDNDPLHMLENTSSLMLMGYLMRASEEQLNKEGPALQEGAMVQ